MAFTYEDSNALGSEKAVASVHRDSNQQEEDSNGDAGMGDKSDKRLDSARRELKLSAFTDYAENFPEND